MPSFQEQLQAPIFDGNGDWDRAVDQRNQYVAELMDNRRQWPLVGQGMGLGFSDEHYVDALGRLRFAGTFPFSAPGYDILANDLAAEGPEGRVQLLREANHRAIMAKTQFVEDRQRERGRAYPVLANSMAILDDFPYTLDDIIASQRVQIACIGAGLPKSIGQRMGQSDAEHMFYGGIVSSGRAAKLFEKVGNRGRPPSFYIYEDPTKAGGHLGVFKRADLDDPEQFEPARALEAIQKEAPGKPVILAGGVAYRNQVQAALDMGYAGVGMGTRLLLTQESGMPDDVIRDIYLNPDAKVRVDDDSPSGFTARRLVIENTARTADTIRHALQNCVSCVGRGQCKYLGNLTDEADPHYCIARDLSKTRRGEPGGIYFTGSQIETMRHDELYRRDGQPYVPTMEEAIEWALTHDAPEQEE